MLASPHVTDALRLRAWALARLAGVDAAAPACSPQAMRLFLANEGGALELVTRQGRQLLDGFPAEVARIFLGRVTDEQKQFLAARGQAAQIGRWARGRPLRILVVKGGVAAVHGAPQVGMADLDILTDESSLQEVAAFLDQDLAFRAMKADAEEGHHLGERVSPGSLRIEVHRRLKQFDDARAVLDRSRPVGAMGLYLPSPQDHLTHLLLHSADTCRDRRGRLRDLVLIADAWQRCTPEERANVDRIAAGRPVPAPLRALLQMAAELAAGRLPEDRFREAAAARFIFAERFTRAGLPRRFARDLSNTTFALVAGGGDFAHCWGSLSRAPWPRGGAGAVLEVPRRAWRAVRLATASAVSVVVSAAARRSVRRLGG